MSESLLSGFLHLKEILRQLVEQNLCCNLLYIQVVNLFKNSFLYRISSKLHGFKNSKISRIPKYRAFWDILGELIVFQCCQFCFFNGDGKSSVIYSKHLEHSLHILTSITQFFTSYNVINFIFLFNSQEIFKQPSTCIQIILWKPSRIEIIGI